LGVRRPIGGRWLASGRPDFARRQRDKETGRQGDKETSKQGEKDSQPGGLQGPSRPDTRSCFSVFHSLFLITRPRLTHPSKLQALSPCLLVSLSPCLPVFRRTRP